MTDFKNILLRCINVAQRRTVGNRPQRRLANTPTTMQNAEQKYSTAQRTHCIGNASTTAEPLDDDLR